MSDLERCPFCGGHATASTPDMTSLHWQEVWVQCDECDARGPGFNFHAFDSEEKPDVVLVWAAAAWNRRIPPRGGDVPRAAEPAE